MIDGRFSCESGEETCFIADEFCVDFGLDLGGGSGTQESMQVTQSRRGYMQESSGSAWVMLRRAVSQRCSFCWREVH
jgi:hypothetical protein